MTGPAADVKGVAEERSQSQQLYVRSDCLFWVARAWCSVASAVRSAYRPDCAQEITLAPLVAQATSVLQELLFSMLQREFYPLHLPPKLSGYR